MNEFEKAWVTSTCAPESIHRLNVVKQGDLNLVANENKSKFALVVSNDKGVVEIYTTTGQRIYYGKYIYKNKRLSISHSEACSKIADYFQVSHIKC